jgi:hypothetical protein
MNTAIIPRGRLKLIVREVAGFQQNLPAARACVARKQNDAVFAPEAISALLNFIARMKASLARKVIRLAAASIEQLAITLSQVYAAIKGFYVANASRFWNSASFVAYKRALWRTVDLPLCE